MSYQDINAATIDRWIKEEDWEWGRAISHEDYIKALNGDWDVKLTPVKFVPHEWFGDFKGKKLLGLASGGGQQIPIFTALGAECTVLDYSDEQLASEKMVAERENYKVNIVKADMTKALPFEDESFDIIFHPVSNCYIESVEPVFKECYRILKKGGILLCGLDTIINYILDENEEKVTFSNVLLIDNNGAVTVGAPAINGASVEAKVLKHVKGDKVIVFKKKRRKGYKVKNGHRQYLTQIVIENIVVK